MHNTTLWDYSFSGGLQNSRITASRILNFICKERYENIWITKVKKEEIKGEFKNNENILYCWSVSSSSVDYIAERLLVNSEELRDFLKRKKFNVKITYNPRRHIREEWFFNTIRVIEGYFPEPDIDRTSEVNFSSGAQRKILKDEKGKLYLLSGTGVRVFVDFRDNLIIDRDAPAVIEQGNNFKYTVGVVCGLSKMGSENSEDAMTWNTLRILDKIHPSLWFPVLFRDIKLKEREYDELEIHLWNWCFPPPKRPVREKASQVDIIMETSETLIFIEAKYKSEISLSTKHDPGRDQIIRNIDVGSYLAKEKGKGFYFVLLLPYFNKISIEKLVQYKNNPHMIKEKIGEYRDDIKDFHLLAKKMSYLCWEDILKLLRKKDFQEKAGIDLKKLIEWLQGKFKTQKSET